MVTSYNVFFVLRLDQRKKITALRSAVCKQVHSTQALQYPVHMSLISGGFQTNNLAAFEKTLRDLCRQQKPMNLRAHKHTSVLPNRFWTGIMITRSAQIKRLQEKLQKLRNDFAQEKQTHQFHPLHITLAYPARVDDLKEITCPVDSLIFDRVCVARKKGPGKPYRIWKYVSFG